MFFYQCLCNPVRVFALSQLMLSFFLSNPELVGYQACRLCSVLSRRTSAVSHGCPLASLPCQLLGVQWCGCICRQTGKSRKNRFHSGLNLLSDYGIKFHSIWSQMNVVFGATNIPLLLTVESVCLQTPPWFGHLHYRQFTWSQRNQISYLYIYNTDTFITRILSFCPFVSLWKRSDCIVKWKLCNYRKTPKAATSNATWRKRKMTSATSYNKTISVIFTLGYPYSKGNI